MCSNSEGGGFTLAELLVVLVVISILAVLLFPNFTKIIPDKNLALFKKANNTLFESIKALVNSDKWYLEGMLDKTPKGKSASAKYFCETLAKTLQTKSVDCSIPISHKDNILSAAKIDLDNIDGEKIALRIEHNMTGFAFDVVRLGDNINDIVSKCVGDNIESGCTDARQAWINMDNICKMYPRNEIVLNDNVVFYQAGDSAFKDIEKMGVTYVIAGGNVTGSDYDSNNPFDSRYKVFCIDIDGIEKGQEPFAYGIKKDGSIIPGCTAQNWINKSENKKGNYIEIDCNIEDEGDRDTDMDMSMVN